MEVSKEKSKTMVNNKNENASIFMDGMLLEEVNPFKYLGATLKSDGASDNELRIRLAAATSAMVRLDNIWYSKNITFHVKYILYKSLILSILLYGCEYWTITEIEEKRIQTFENKAHRRLLCIIYRQHKPNKYVQEIILNQIGKYEPLLIRL